MSSDIKDLESLLNAKADRFHNHESQYPTFEYLEEKLADISGEVSVDLTNYVTNELMEEALNRKANKEHNHIISNVEGLQDELNNKFNKNETYSRDDIDVAIAAPTTPKAGKPNFPNINI